MTDLNRLSATEAARKLATREITAVALLSACLERIAEREPSVHAWTFLDSGGALQRARALDAQPSSGLLHGLPIAVKDLFDTFDMPTAYGSPIYAEHRPAADAACVALARAAGAIVVGKTVTTEFATFHPGPTCNPHNTKHTPGGSSSGSAAAVADWMVPLGFASQTAGSIVRPAAFCGVVGYKPTYGTINRVGVKMISDTLDTIGVLARSVPDAALFVGALSGRRELLIERPLGGCAARRPVPNLRMVSRCSGDGSRCSTMRRGDSVKPGASVRDVVLPPSFAGLVDAQLAIMVHEVAKSLSHEWLVHRRQLSREMITMIEAGLAVTPERYDAAQALARSSRSSARRCLRRHRRRDRAEHRRRSAGGDPSDRRSAVQPDVDAAARAVRPSARWGGGREDCRSASLSRDRCGADRATLLAADWIYGKLGQR